jgi:hypothetical protein
VRGRFPPPSSLKHPENVLHEEWYNTTLEMFRSDMSLFQDGYKLYYRTLVAPHFSEIHLARVTQKDLHLVL